jgi:hypothetical protein
MDRVRKFFVSDPSTIARQYRPSVAWASQVARMPYFAYTTCLHLYETLGWWRTGGLRLIHFAEEWNELHHRTIPILQQTVATGAQMPVLWLIPLCAPVKEMTSTP